MIVATLVLAGLVATPAHAARTEGFTIKNAIVKDNPESDIQADPARFPLTGPSQSAPKLAKGLK